MSSTNQNLAYYNTLIGTKINNTYQIDEMIGAGGMGAVFCATHLTQHFKVALKVISPDLATTDVFMKRFQREAKVGWVLSHPNIIKVLEYGKTDDNLLFMVMEFFEGEPLNKYLKTHGRLDAIDALAILKPLCEALDLAHKRNILHRDLKPANILINKDKVIKLVDFGIVKLMQADSEISEASNLTAMGETFGTPHYMSPEQLLGGVLGPPTDIYSVGVIAYEMITGVLPIATNDFQQLFVRKLKKDPFPLSKQYSFIPKEFDEVIHKALMTDPEERYQTVNDFIKDFGELAKKFPHWKAIPTNKLNENRPELPTVGGSSTIGSMPTVVNPSPLATRPITASELSRPTVANINSEQPTIVGRTSANNSPSPENSKKGNNNTPPSMPSFSTMTERPSEKAGGESVSKVVYILGGVAVLVLIILAVLLLK